MTYRLCEDANEESPTVPLKPPYGSITDGSVVCSRCGMDLTGCALCAGMKIAVRILPSDMN